MTAGVLYTDGHGPVKGFIRYETDFTLDKRRLLNVLCAWVAPEHRRKSIGKRLFDIAIRQESAQAIRGHALPIGSALVASTLRTHPFIERVY